MRKRALILGGSSGIGKATAEKLLNEGVEVHVVGTKIKKLKTFKNSMAISIFTMMIRMIRFI